DRSDQGVKPLLSPSTPGLAVLFCGNGLNKEISQQIPSFGLNTEYRSQGLLIAPYIGYLRLTDRKSEFSHGLDPKLTLRMEKNGDESSIHDPTDYLSS
ncbi:MAG: hypothetical protein ABW072_11020, partial [Sedimenticola sp.]